MRKLSAIFLTLTMLLGLPACASDEIVAAVDTAATLITEIEGLEKTIGAAGSAVLDAAGFPGADAAETGDTSSAVAGSEDETTTNDAQSAPIEVRIDEDGWYYSKDDVSEYIYTYNCLPENFITKDEARDLGWNGGSVEVYAEGCAIGGDKFSNREGLLPKESGRIYYECDIDTNGASSRGAKRIVFSNDGLIYYTDNHYESFTLLYGEE